MHYGVPPDVIGAESPDSDQTEFNGNWGRIGSQVEKREVLFEGEIFAEWLSDMRIARESCFVQDRAMTGCVSPLPRSFTISQLTRKKIGRREDMKQSKVYWSKNALISTERGGGKSAQACRLQG
jgi:hypothetical protein